MSQKSFELPPAVHEALTSGRKIEAIKLYREMTGVGLYEAKELVEAYQRRLRVPADDRLTPSRPLQESSGPMRETPSPPLRDSARIESSGCGSVLALLAGAAVLLARWL